MLGSRIYLFFIFSTGNLIFKIVFGHFSIKSAPFCPRKKRKTLFYGETSPFRSRFQKIKMEFEVLTQLCLLLTADSNLTVSCKIDFVQLDFVWGKKCPRRGVMGSLYKKLDFTPIFGFFFFAIFAKFIDLTLAQN